MIYHHKTILGSLLFIIILISIPLAKADSPLLLDRFKEVFKTKQDHLKLIPAFLNRHVQMGIALKLNLSPREEIKLQTDDQIILKFPKFWYSQPPPKPINCSITFNKKDSYPLSATWLVVPDTIPINEAINIITYQLVLNSTQTIAFHSQDQIHLLCNDLLTPFELPPESLNNMKNVPKLHLIIQQYNANDKTYIKLHESTLTYDRQLQLSPKFYFLLISSSDIINEQDTQSLLTPYRSFPNKYHYGICAYIEQVTDIESCKIYEQQITPKSLLLLYSLQDKNIKLIADLLNAFGSKYENGLESFRKFVQQILKLNQPPTITLHELPSI